MIDTSSLPFVDASLAYLGEGDAPLRFAIHPPSTGRPSEEPPKARHAARVHDCRAIAAVLDLDRDGLLLATRPTACDDFLDPAAVRARYYAETEALVRDLTGALAVVVFDHNVRSASGAVEGWAGVRAPVDCVHGDYTERSGRRRIAEILAAHGRGDLRDRRASLVNVWRPIHAPVRDLPLAVCLPDSVADADLVATPIEHYGEDGLASPAHAGEIYCVRHRPGHRWLYASSMTPAEALVFKTYDTRSGVSRFTPHTGFRDPTCPPRFHPRESIEARVLVVHAEGRP